jgi:hypothetical protein
MMAGSGRLSAFFARQRKRIRLGSVSEVSRRGDGRFYLDNEIGDGLVAFLPGLVLALMGAPGPWVAGFLIAGGTVYLLWFLFVMWHWLRAGARHGDKMYTLVTRKKLSKEYRDG